jgi:amiloride-sensitive sodium channel
LRKFSPQIRECYFESERKLKFFKSYTKAHCDYECMTNYTLKVCGCVKFSMPRTFTTPVCDLDKVECFKNVIKNWPTWNNETIECNCYPPCSNINYKIESLRENLIIIDYESAYERE